MRKLLVLVCLGACAPSQGTPGSPVTRDVWEPFGQPGMRYGRLAMDGADVWFIADQYPGTSQGTLFLTKTTTSGDTLVPMTNVDGPGPQYLGWSALTPTDAGLTIGFMRAEQTGDHPYVRAFDHEGVATAAAARVPVVVGGVEAGNTYALALAAARDGHARLMTSLSGMQNEVALVDLDAAGAATGTSVATGTADGDQVSTLAAATLADDSTLIAWDRVYDACHGDNRPASTLTTVVDPAWNVGTPAPLSADEDMTPAVASTGDATYLAWTQFAPGGTTMSLSSYPALDTAISIGPAWQPPAIALADAQHGVLAWFTSDSILNVQAFENTGSTIALRELRTVAPMDTDPAVYKSLAGVASLGGTRYLVAWEEQPQDWLGTRLYATVVDLADPAPPMAPRATPRALALPCDRQSPRDGHTLPTMPTRVR